MRLLRILVAVACLAPPVLAHADGASVLVTTIKPHRGAVPETVTGYGTAAPGPGTTTNLNVPRAGQVVQLSAEPGVLVHAGDKLVQFTASAAAVQAYDQAVAGLAVAQKQRTHTAELLAQHLATRSQLAQADKAVADAQAALDAQRREGGGNPTQSLTAPFDGIVTAVAVKPGDRVSAGAPLLTLARTNGIVVTVGVEPSLRSKLRSGEKVKLQPLQSGESTIDGKVAQVDAMLNPATRQIGVEVAVAPGSVLSGESFRGEIVVGQFHGWRVPRDAVLFDSKGAYVFQVNAGKAQRVNVHVVGTFGQTTVIDGAINPQHTLVTEGNYQLTDGMAVREQGSLS